MITKKALKIYSWTRIEQYFDYIIESKINGNYSQVRSLISDLSKDQKKQFINYCDVQIMNDDIKHCKNKTLSLL